MLSKLLDFLHKLISGALANRLLIKKYVCIKTNSLSFNLPRIFQVMAKCALKAIQTIIQNFFFGKCFSICGVFTAKSNSCKLF